MNLYELPNLPFTQELTSVLLDQPAVRVERIVSTGQVSDWYDQEEQEFVVLLQGTAKLEYENGQEVPLSGGDTLLIPAHQRHRVSATSDQPPCIWLCIFWS